MLTIWVHFKVPLNVKPMQIWLFIVGLLQSPPQYWGYLLPQPFIMKSYFKKKPTFLILLPHSTPLKHIHVHPSNMGHLLSLPPTDCIALLHLHYMLRI